MCNSLYVRGFGNIILCLCVNLSLKLQQAGDNNLKEHSIMLRHFIRGPWKLKCVLGAGVGPVRQPSLWDTFQNPYFLG